MKKIDKHIEELLHDHDCVIVPDFGGFITSKKPAYFNQFTSVFFPATKRILFNKHLVFNDGLLSAKIAEKQSLSMAEAQQMLLEFKDDCFLRLNEEGRVEIERVGVLFFDKEKNIQFQQASTNFLKDSYGLSAISIEKLVSPVTKPKKETPVKIISRIEEQKVSEVAKPKVQKESKPKTTKRYGQLVPLLMVPILAAGLYFGIQTEVPYNKLNIADINPFNPVYVQEYTPRTNQEFALIWENEDIITAKVVDEVVPEKEIELEVIPAKIDSTFIKPIEFTAVKSYHVIAGCFSVKENADNLVEDWKRKGNESKIVDKKGSLYRVAIQSFATRKEAKQFLASTKQEEGISLWVLKK